MDDTDFHDQTLMEPYQPETCPNCSSVTQPNNPFCSKCKLDLRYGSPKRITSGSCLYCEFAGKLSVEHVFGRWLHARYPKPIEQRWHQVGRPERYAFWEEVPMHHVHESRRGSPYTLTVHNVCSKCNNGWMSQLHVAARPLVEQLADGFWPRLTFEQCAVLARWAIMVTINIETYARIKTVTEFQRKELSEGHVPAGFRVTMGRMTGPRFAGHHHQRTFKLPIAVGDDHLTLQSTFFCIENVCFHIISSLGDNLLGLGTTVGGISQVAMPRGVWPINDPPKISNKTKFEVEDIAYLQDLGMSGAAL